MRKAEVYLFDRLAGYIEERDPRGFRFWYDKTYLSDSQAIPLSPLMPLSRDVVETEEMVGRTIEKLEWIDSHRPLCVLVADRHNCDPLAVKVLVMGEKVGYIDRSQAADVRAMLKTVPRGMLVTEVERVCVGRHGYFYLRKPEAAADCMPEVAMADWDRFLSPGMDVLADDYFVGYEGVSMVIGEVLLPRLAETDVDELRRYIDQWMGFARYNQSMEVMNDMGEYIKVLSFN